MTYRELLGDLDQWFARGIAEAGPGVVLCRRGCSACCMGPFDISPADAERVAAAVDQLDASLQLQIHSRAAEQLARYTALAQGWTAPWNVETLGDDAFDRLSDALADMPCPALSSEGVCGIYQDRPATCRMTGLAMTTAQDDILENVCPILDTSAAYARLNPTFFDLSQFEDGAEDWDALATAKGWVTTTVAGAIAGTDHLLR